MSKGKFLSIAITLALAAFLVVPYAMLLGPAQLREYLHKQIIYKAIAENIAGREDFSREEQARRLFYFIQTHIYEPAREGGPDKNSLDNLVRGHGACDQQANALIHLAGKMGIKGRLLFLMGASHSVCDLHIDGIYRIFDPYFGIILADADNSIPSFEDIADRFNDYSSPQLAGLEKFIGYSRDSYYTYFSNGYDVFHTNFESGRLRQLINSVADIHYSLFGAHFVACAQNLFFQMEETSSYLRARYLHLAFRLKEAIDLYEGLLEQENAPSGSHERLLYYLGQAFWDGHDYPATISSYEKLLSIYPETRFSSGVYTSLGDAYLKTGEPKTARAILTKCRDIQSPVPTMLLELDEEPAENN